MYCIYYMCKMKFMDEEFWVYCEKCMVDLDVYLVKYCCVIVELVVVCSIVLVSYDDVISVYVDELFDYGVWIVEFLIMMEVVSVLKGVGFFILMGVFNIVCGGLYFGNIVVCDFVDNGSFDILFLDYILFSFIQLVFGFVLGECLIVLLQVVCFVIKNLVDVMVMDDCGEIVIGKCVDLVCVWLKGVILVVCIVWCEGEWVF